MPTIQYTAQLDFTDNGTFETGWRIKQGDFGDCEIVFRVVNNGVNMYDALVTPEIVFRRADGASVISNMTPNDGTYKYTFVGNELAVPGLTLVDVKYTDSEGRISTASCRFTVVEDTLGYDPTGAHTYDNPVSELVEQATAASEVAIDSSYKAEGFAVGEQGGVPVGPDSPYYHNNAKYYGQELAREIEVNKQNGYLQNKNLWHYSLTHNNSFQYAYEMPSDARTFTISIKKTLAKQINACVFDTEGTKIVADFKIVGADETSGSYTFTVNTACFLNIYIVSSVAGDDSQVSEVQVEVGSTATAYIPYALSNIELGEDIKYNKQNGYLAKNLFNKNTSINGYRLDSSGQPYAAPNYTLSDWIPVKPSTDYIRNTDIIETSTSVALYKADKTFITRVPSSSIGRFTTTADTAYIRSAIYGNELETTQIEEGTVSSPYMQYALSNIELANSKADITSIGTDESGRTTASKAYAQGDIFYKDGFIGEALTSVASGATWTLNTNYKRTTLAEIVAELRA